MNNGRDEAFSKLLEIILNQVLMVQSSEQLGAAPYERTEDCTAYRNGFRERALTTRVGTLTLRVPRHRNGEFSTSIFERYQRSEQALVLAMIESEESWGEFFSELKERGLKSVGLVTSDDHKGLVKAIRKHFQGTGWQRCQTHFSRNVLDKTPNKHQSEVKQCLSSIYNSKNLEEARRL